MARIAIRSVRYARYARGGVSPVASCHEVYEMLGVDGNRLPVDGTAPREVQGITVWVEPQGPMPAGRRKRHKHRVMATCPACGRTVPVGRLWQHSKVHENQEAAMK